MRKIQFAIQLGNAPILHAKNILHADVTKRIAAWMRDRHSGGIVCFHNTLLSSFQNHRSGLLGATVRLETWRNPPIVWKNSVSMPCCSRSRAHRVKCHACHEFVWQWRLQVSILHQSTTSEWRQSKDQRLVMKQAGTIMDCEHRYTLGNALGRTEKLWAGSSQDLTQLSQWFMSCRKRCPEPKAKRRLTDLPFQKSERKLDWISSWVASERKRMEYYLCTTDEFVISSGKENLRIWMTENTYFSFHSSERY